MQITTDAVMATLTEALDHHRAGRQNQAASGYRHVLSIQPLQPSALYLYGTLLLAKGDLDAAEPLLMRAVELRPDHAECRLALANVRHRLGDAHGAAALWHEVLGMEPGHVAASLNLAAVQRVGGDWQAASATCRRALELLPTHAGLWLALAAALLAGQCWDAAHTAATSVLELDAGIAEAWLIRGTVFSRRRRFDDALRDLRQAVALDPSSARAVLHLGNALLDLDQLRPAEDLLRQAVALDPLLPEAHTSLGFLLSSQRQIDAAVAAHDRALALRPDFSDAHSNRAAALLLAGDYAAGLDEYEWRKHNPLFEACYWASDRPPWTGEDLAGRTILVFCEQGFGDTIMCARFLPELSARGGAIVLVCAASLIPLLRDLPGVIALVPRGDPKAGRRVAEGHPVPDHDTWIDQMSLLQVLGVRPGAITGAGAYLTATLDRVLHWWARLPDGCKIGLAWSGNPAHSNDHRRSVPLSMLAPLLQVDGLAFVSLQIDDTTAARGAGLCVIADGLTDYAQTAAAISCLDLVICVDTSVAHLAGALGKPTWLMLPYAAEWRWLQDRDDSPWYDSMRLFRQDEPAGWTGLVDRVAAELMRWRESSTP